MKQLFLNAITNLYGSLDTVFVAVSDCGFRFRTCRKPKMFIYFFSDQPGILFEITLWSMLYKFFGCVEDTTEDKAILRNE